MKKINLFLKYYTYGFLLSTLMVAVVHLYGFLIDNFYAYYDFKISITAVSLVAIPIGLNFWVINFLSKPLKFKNQKIQYVVAGAVSYWIGILFSLCALILILLCCFVFGFNSFYTVLDSMVFQIAFIAGYPMSIILKKLNFFDIRV